MAEYFPIDVSSFGSYSGSFSGSFFGNGSRLTGITASFFSGSVTSASYAATASYLLGSIASASYALTASYVNPLVQDVIITGSIYIPDSTNSIYFSGSGAASRLVWNDTDGTLDLGLKGGNVTLQIGQEQVIRVVNKTGANLLEADYKAVRIRRVDEGGAQGQRLAIVLAQANNDANSVDTLGLVTEDIAVNQEGFITNSGLVRNIDTTGTLQGETWVDGDVLYLSPTISGSVTKVKPQAPQHTIVMGYVVYAHQNNGKIFVKVDNGYELDELHNVRITTASLSSGDLLVYSSSVWVNAKQLTGSYGLTGSLQATSFTGSLFGTASWATNALTASFVNTASTNAFVQNGNSFGATALLGTNDNQSLAFETSGSTRMFISSSGNVGIGTTTPAYTLDVSGTTRFNGASLTLGTTGLLSTWQGTNHSLYFYHENTTTFRILSSLGPALDVKADSFRFVNSPLVVGANVTPLGKLHVQGTGATSATTALRVENSSASPSLVVLDNGYVGIGTGSASYKLDVLDSAATYVAQFRGSNSSYVVSGDTSLTGESGFNSRNSSGQMFLAISASIVSLSATSGANTMAFNTGGTERMRINSVGNVGIGITSPAYNLHVTNSIAAGIANSTNGTIRIERSGGGTGLIVRGSDGNIVGAGNSPVYEPYNYADASHNFNIGHASAGNYNWFAGTNATLNLNTQLMRLTRGGNLLIGTTADAGYKLTVSGGLLLTGSALNAPLVLSDGNYIYGGGNTASANAIFGAISTQTELYARNDRIGIWSGAGAGNYLYSVGGNFGIGIGANTPSARVQVRGSGATSATTALRVENTNASASLVVRDNGNVEIGSTGSGLYWDNTNLGLAIGGTTLDTSYALQINSAKGIRISGSGAGIGYSLVRGTEIAGLATGTTFSLLYSTTQLRFETAANERMRIFQTGNISIGTTTDAGFKLDVSGSGRFTNGLTVTGSLIAPSITGSLQGTASWATNVVSASGASTNVQYNSSGLLAGNNRFTFDGTTVRVSGGSLIITGSSIISGSSIITGSLQVGVPGTNAAAIDTTTGTLSRGPVTTIDWVNRNLQDTSGVTSADWENKALYDTSAVTSVDWENRILYTPNSLEAFNYSRTTDDLVSSQLYSSNIVSIDVQQNLVSNNLYAGQIISGSIDAGVTAYDIMYLDTDGTWKSLKNLPVVSTKMLGIEVDGNILLDGDMTVSDDGSVGTYVVSADHGLPVYISGTTGRLTTVVPGSDVIRIVGHIYYQDPVNTNVWLMKFRPSNDWA